MPANCNGVLLVRHENLPHQRVETAPSCRPCSLSRKQKVLACTVGCRHKPTSQNQVRGRWGGELGVQKEALGSWKGDSGITETAPERKTSDVQSHCDSIQAFQNALAVTMTVAMALTVPLPNCAQVAQQQSKTRQGHRNLAWRMRCTMTCSKGGMTATPCRTNQGCCNISASVARSASLCSNSLLTQCLASSLMPGQGFAEKISCLPALHTDRCRRCFFARHHLQCHHCRHGGLERAGEGGLRQWDVVRISCAV